jgi:threonyl-tRNA synthetase
VRGDARSYAQSADQQLADQGIRSEIDQRDATLGARIRSAQQRKIPYLVVVGSREANDGTVSIRLRTGEQLDPMQVEAFTGLAKAVIDNHHLKPGRRMTKTSNPAQARGTGRAR